MRMSETKTRYGSQCCKQHVKADQCMSSVWSSDMVWDQIAPADEKRTWTNVRSVSLPVDCHLTWGHRDLIDTNTEMTAATILKVSETRRQLYCMDRLTFHQETISYKKIPHTFSSIILAFIFLMTALQNMWASSFAL